MDVYVCNIKMILKSGWSLRHGKLCTCILNTTTPSASLIKIEVYGEGSGTDTSVHSEVAYVFFLSSVISWIYSILPKNESFRPQSLKKKILKSYQLTWGELFETNYSFHGHNFKLYLLK